MTDEDTVIRSHAQRYLGSGILALLGVLVLAPCLHSQAPEAPARPLSSHAHADDPCCFSSDAGRYQETHPPCLVVVAAARLMSEGESGQAVPASASPDWVDATPFGGLSACRDDLRRDVGVSSLPLYTLHRQYRL
ncbi:MAG: hypothetical protein HY207_04245 [Nitrospirae bacterium]|nr:hypothetical protein [Nitrospirota bacterium]